MLTLYLLIMHCLHYSGTWDSFLVGSAVLVAVNADGSATVWIPTTGMAANLAIMMSLRPAMDSLLRQAGKPMGMPVSVSMVSNLGHYPVVTWAVATGQLNITLKVMTAPWTTGYNFTTAQLPNITSGLQTWVQQYNITNALLVQNNDNGTAPLRALVNADASLTLLFSPSGATSAAAISLAFSNSANHLLMLMGRTGGLAYSRVDSWVVDPNAGTTALTMVQPKPIRVQLLPPTSGSNNRSLAAVQQVTWSVAVQEWLEMNGLNNNLTTLSIGGGAVSSNTLETNIFTAGKVANEAIKSKLVARAGQLLALVGRPGLRANVSFVVPGNPSIGSTQTGQAACNFTFSSGSVKLFNNSVGKSVALNQPTKSSSHCWHLARLQSFQQKHTVCSCYSLSPVLHF